MSSEWCVMCGKEIPEGRQVCPLCETKVIEGERPVGFLSSADVEMLSGLRGHQICQLFHEYGTKIGNRTWIATRLFNELDVDGKIQSYRAYPMYGPRIRKQGSKDKAQRRMKWRYGWDESVQGLSKERNRMPREVRGVCQVQGGKGQRD